MNIKKYLKNPWVWVGIAAVAFFVFGFGKQLIPSAPPAAPGTGQVPNPPGGGSQSTPQ